MQCGDLYDLFKDCTKELLYLVSVEFYHTFLSSLLQVNIKYNFYNILNYMFILGYTQMKSIVLHIEVEPR